MINISKLNSINHEVLLNNQPAKKENSIEKKISIIAKKVFSCLYSYRTAIATGLWSYVFIEVGIAAAKLATTEPVYDLESCQNTLCYHWNNNTEARSHFSPLVRFRCNSSHPYYSPFSFVDQCMYDLCQYMTNIGRKSLECNQYSSDSLNKAWNEICPDKEKKDWSSLKRAKHLDRCFINLCNKYKVLKINLPKSIEDWCKDKNLWLLRNALKISYKELNRLDSSTNQWTSNDFLKTIIKGVEDILAGINSMLITALKSAPYENAAFMETVDSLKDSLEEILYVASENIQYLVSEVNTTEEVIPELTKKNLLGLSSIMENLYFSDQNSTQSLLSLHREFKNDHVLTYMVGNKIRHNGEQLTRLLSHLDKWEGAYCFYTFPETFFCRLPLPFRNSIVDEPPIQLRRLAKYSNSLCFYLSEYEETWCNFAKVLNAICYKRKSSLISHCYLDHMLLEVGITKNNYYKFTLVGDSCNETFVFDKRC